MFNDSHKLINEILNIKYVYFMYIPPRPQLVSAAEIQNPILNMNSINNYSIQGDNDELQQNYL